MKLQNKSALIIGGATGIGLAITRRLASEGCNLFISYNSDPGKERAAALREEFKDMKIEYNFEKMDLIHKDQIKSFFNRLKIEYPILDIAINNAGVSTMNNFVDLTEEDWDLNMDINAKGMFFCCQEEARIMIKQNHGKIINIASLASKIGAAFLAHYSASKYAVLGLTFTMAKELAKYNINVNAVCPGVVLTDMIKREWAWEAGLRGVDQEKFVKEWQESIPLGRFATPEDISNMVKFLASEEADYITGQAFNVDGGIENH